MRMDYLWSDTWRCRLDQNVHNKQVSTKNMFSSNIPKSHKGLSHVVVLDIHSFSETEEYTETSDDVAWVSGAL